MLNIQLDLLGTQVAAALGDGWTHVSKKDNAGYHRWTEIHHKDGYGVSIAFSEGWGAKKGKDRLNIHGLYPVVIDATGRREEFNPSRLWNPDETAPEITVDAVRAAADVAKEIQRRLLPEYIRIWGRCKQRADASADYETRKARAREELACVPGVRMGSLKGGGESAFMGGFKKDPNSQNGRDADIRINSADSIEIKVDSLNADKAEKLLEFLRTL